MKKFLCIFLILLILALSGCTSAKPIQGTEEELKIVGNVGDFEVLYEEFRFAVLTYKKLLVEIHGEGIFSNEEFAEKYSNEIREYVYSNITSNYAILSLCKEVGIEADDPALAEYVQKSVETAVKELGSTRKYKNYLRDNFMTDHFFRFNTCVDKMQQELFYVYLDDLALIESDDDKIYDIISDTFVRTQHIYISKSNGKSYEENKTAIENTYSELLNGSDFMSMASAVGEDPELTSDGFYITAGYMTEAYEKAAFSLEHDEISNIVEDDNGFYIIKRLKQDTLYVMMNFDMLAERYQNYTFMEMINKKQKELEFVPNDYLISLDILSIE